MHRGLNRGADGESRVRWHEGVKPEELLTGSYRYRNTTQKPSTLQKGIILHMHDFKWFLAT